MSRKQNLRLRDDYLQKVFVYLMDGDEILEEYKVPVSDPTPLSQCISKIVYDYQHEFTFNCSLSILVKPVYKEGVLPF